MGASLSSAIGDSQDLRLKIPIDRLKYKQDEKQVHECNPSDHTGRKALLKEEDIFVNPLQDRKGSYIEG